MGRKSKNPFVHQLKTVDDIGKKIQELIEKHRSLTGSALGVMFRTVISPNESTLYKEGHHGRGEIKKGIRECDYKFSESDPNWVEASNEHGLSFSLTYEHAVSTMIFLGGFQKKGTKINCAYWVLENDMSIPDDMKFVQDPDNPEHYLLLVTKPMYIDKLVYKLTLISQKMSLISEFPLEAFKNA